MTLFGQFSGLVLLLLAAMLLSLSLGNYPMTVTDILHFLGALTGISAMDAAQYDLLYNILIDVRLPRVLAAVLVGMALSGSGAAFQAVFRNPLVSPGMLGVLAGASFGATLGMLWHGSWLVIQSSAFLFGLLAVALGVAIGMIFGRGSIITLLLGGIISSALFSALLSMVKFVADPQDELPSIIYWLMGSLGLSSLSDVLWLVPVMLLAVLVLCGFGRALDAMSMGDDEAKALGVPVLWVRYGVIIAATMASALSVSIAGIVGWVGLLTPHVARMLVGPANARLMPVSIVLGAIFLLLADCLSRVISQVEVPIGIVTECLGLPLFLLVLHRARKGWN
ncbi:FecCD family ABC transporter permease [Shewanella dokdonensis]|uniref:Iron ABC transporter permease n=1 Tax=Shewanella dokdonensis TaxID=712036 RepID=A0ABX8DAX1_9GAMM|nr:iron ABC transporter permease [Shewanella dokdonensis]MCL1075288.1 iron ABC transporter permease [Shewanella dokdonensis]QVK22005.1 iron ABC transporter permease [Shewanella dokdonensis]